MGCKCKIFVYCRKYINDKSKFQRMLKKNKEKHKNNRGNLQEDAQEGKIMRSKSSIRYSKKAFI